MASILPVSDLRNCDEVLKNCRAGEPVFLTKNGRGRFVVLDIEDYERERAEKKLLMKLRINPLVVSDLQEIREDETLPAPAPRPLLLLIQIFHLKVLFQLSSLILLCDVGTLVIELLSARQADLHLHQAPFEINLERHQGQALFLELSL